MRSDAYGFGAWGAGASEPITEEGSMIPWYWIPIVAWAGAAIGYLGAAIMMIVKRADLDLPRPPGA